MVTLPPVKEYSLDQLASARLRSPAIHRYLDLLDKKPTSDSDELRLRRHRAWVRAALACLIGNRSAAEVCLFWSLETEALLKDAWNRAGLDNGPLALVAMGKLGARELNLSSDIDVFFVSSSAVEKSDLKKLRHFLNLLTEATPLGFCYRVDMDLRPGGSTQSLVMNFDQFTNHYGYHGETWERVAMIRQHVFLGPPQLCREISEFCRKFAFRRHIDYGLFADLYSMRSKIQAQHATRSQLNLKFQKGGIRDLELLIHSLQLIHGGKHLNLRTSSTTQAVQELKKGGWIPETEADLLLATYWRYRDWENRIQLYGDQHTYDIPTGAGSLLSPDEVREFQKLAQQISAIVDQFLSPYVTKNEAIKSEELLNSFHDLGLEGDELQTLWHNLVKSEAVSREKGRDEQERRLFLRNILQHLQEGSVDRPLALHHLSQFLQSIKAKASFFSLFNQHQELISELVWIFSCSPYLSQILIHRPELMDSFLLKTVNIDRSDENQFYQSLQEYKLLSDLIASSSFLRNRNVETLTENLSRTTDKIVTELLQFLEGKLGESIRVLALGKWAGREMGLTSDLDFVFLSEKSPEAAHIKMARRFINFLQSPTKGQTLYSIDLRLRPSGHAGPLLMTLDDLRTHLNSTAQTWEREAYLSYRILGESDMPPLFAPRPLTAEEEIQLRDIQLQLFSRDSQLINLKKAPGGLLQTELTLQKCALRQQAFPQAPGLEALSRQLAPLYEQGLCESIFENYQSLRVYQQLIILISGNPTNSVDVQSPLFEKLSLLTKTTPKVLLGNLVELLNRQQSLLNKLDPLELDFKIEL